MFNFQIEENLNVKNKGKFFTIIKNYLRGLIFTRERKNCCKMAQYLNYSHDKIYKFFKYARLLIPLIKNIPLNVAIALSKISPKSSLIVDDSSIVKMFASIIEGICYGYNSILNRPVKGINIVVIAWTNGDISIPIKFKIWVNRKTSGPLYKKKTCLAKELISEVADKIKYDFLLMDGLYSSLDMINFCLRNCIRFIMRIHRNRCIISPDGKRVQLQNCKDLKFMRNERTKVICAYYHGEKYYFIAEKFKNKKGEIEIRFFISNVFLQPKEYVNIYNKRWKIEETFRTMKQSLGINDCQCISFKKQELHIFAIFAAFSFLQYLKYHYKRKISTEKIISQFRWQKRPFPDVVFNDWMGTFM